MSRSLLGKKASAKADIGASVNARVRDALFGLSRNAPHLVEIPVDRIQPNPDQPRRHFDEDELQELADSIRQHGLQQPVGVKQTGDDEWQLVFGERRWRAVRLLGQDTIFGVLVAGDSREIALIENLQRTDLTPFEESDAFARLVEKFGYSHRKLIEVTGRTRKKTYITMILALQKLAPLIREEYDAVRPTKAKLEALAAIEDRDEQIRAWEALKRGSLPSPAPRDAVESPAAATGAAAATAGADGETASKLRRPAVSAPAGVALSHLPRRAAAPVFKARDVLIELRARPQRLAEVDRAALQEMREAIDAILAGGDAPDRDE